MSNDASIGLRVYLEDQVTSGLNVINEALGSLATGAVQAGDVAAGSLEKLAEAAKPVTEAINEVATAQEELTPSSEGLAKATDSVAQSAEDAITPISELATEIGSVVTGMSAWGNIKWGDTLDAEAGSMEALISESQRLNETFAYTPSMLEEITKSTYSMDDALALSRSSFTGVEAGAEDLYASVQPIAEELNMTAAEFLVLQGDALNAGRSLSDFYQIMAGGSPPTKEEVADLQMLADAAAEAGMTVDELKARIESASETAHYHAQAVGEETVATEASVLAQEEATTATEANTVATEQATTAQKDNAEASHSMAGGFMAMMFGQQAFNALKTSVMDLVNSAGTLQESFTRVNISAHGTSQEITSLDDYIVTLSDNSKFSTEQIAEGFQLMSERTFTAKQIMDGMGQAVVDLAEATNQQLAPATDLVSMTMKTFGLNVNDTSKYASELLYAFQNGIPNLSTLQTALEHVGGTARTLKIPFEDLLSALLFLVNNGMPDATTAGTALNYMLNQLSSATPGAATAMKKLGIEAYDAHGNFKGLPEVLQEMVTQLNKLPTDKARADALHAIFSTRSGQGAKLIANDPGIMDDLMKLIEGTKSAGGGGSGKIDLLTKTMQQIDQDFNQIKDKLGSTLQSLIGTFGLPLLNIIGPIASKVNDLAGTLQKGHDGAKAFFTGFMVVLMIAAPLGLIIGGIAIVATLMSGVAPLLLGIVAVVGLLAVGGGLVMKNWHPAGGVIHTIVQAFQQFSGFIQSNVMPIINRLVAAFTPIIQEIIKTSMEVFKSEHTFSQVKIAVGQLGAALHGLGPVIKVGFSVFSAVVIPVLTMVLHVVVIVFAGVIRAILGAVTFIIGVYHVLASIFLAIGALFLLLTGHSDKASAMIQQSWKQLVIGFTAIWQGLWNVIMGLGKALFFGLIGIFTGLGTGVIAIFHNLYMVLVGNSIVPDMVRAIIQWIASMPGAIFGYVASLASGFISRITGMASQAPTIFNNMKNAIVAAVMSLGSLLFNAGSNAVQMFANGIGSMIGSVVAQANNLASSVKNILGFHSPPKEGPLSDSDQYMGNMMKMYASGIVAHKHLVTNAVGDVAAGIHSTLSSPSIARAQAANFSGSGANGGQNVYNFNVDGKPLVQVFHDQVTGQLKMNGAARQWR